MTHDKIKALDNLIAAVESGDFLLGAIKGMLEDKAYDAFSGSLDAAKALHDALLPGWTWTRWPQGDFEVGKGFGEFYIGKSLDPARAWLIAILKAYRAQMEAS